MNVEMRTRGTTHHAEHAIVLYGSGVGGGGFATHHPVEMVNGRPTIRAGEVMGAAALQAILTSLIPARRISYIDERLLAWSEEGMVWWVPRGKRRVFFNTDGEDGLGQVAGEVTHPGLVFVVAGGWRVFALKGGERPDPGTALWRAPYYNVSANGAICTGNVKVPEEARPEDREGFERAFFESNFTHANVQAARELTRYRGGLRGLWRSRLENPNRRFPESSMVAAGVTLGKVIERIARN